MMYTSAATNGQPCPTPESATPIIAKGGEAHDPEDVSSSLTSSSSGAWSERGPLIPVPDTNAIRNSRPDNLSSRNGVRPPADDPPTMSWVEWFCQLKDNGMFCEVDRSFLEDRFNSAGLEDIVPYFSRAFDIILDLDDTAEMESMDENTCDAIESAAEMLYGLLHQRYVLSQRGMKRMYRKYQNYDFGRCHRVHCHGQPMLPVGQSDLPNVTTVNLFCPKCKDIYFPQKAGEGNIDGAYFGTSFPHVFLMRYPSEVPDPPQSSYEPRVYGFRLHKSSIYGPLPERSQGSVTMAQSPLQSGVI